MKAPTLAELTAKIETIQHHSPENFAALDRVVNMVVDRLKDDRKAERVGRGRLLTRLQARHDCKQPDGGPFEQIEPKGRVRQWRCGGCGLIVTLD